jgi:hypothetical protein
VLVSLCRTSLQIPGDVEQNIQYLLRLLEDAIETSETRACEPFLHELKAGLAQHLNDPVTYTAELALAKDLWRTIGATSHIARMEAHPPAA